MQLMIRYGCKALGVPHSAAVNWVVGKLRSIVDDTATSVGDIVEVQPVGVASVSSLPQIIISKSDGTVAAFGVSVPIENSRFGLPLPNWSHRHNDSRDELVNIVRDVFIQQRR